ncbi:MAG: response regulator [Verrucomicrobiota bacterium]|nr:response regulator [Verrucomicrobiota bacterium]
MATPTEATKTILLADDNLVIVTAYRTILAREGFKVVVAEDGVAAAKMLAAEKPDLVVMDLMMPRLTGTDVIKFIRNTPATSTLPIVVLSDASIADIGQEAIKLGVEKVFLKAQCTPAALVAAIKELLGGPSQAAA